MMIDDRPNTVSTRTIVVPNPVDLAPSEFTQNNNNNINDNNIHITYRLHIICISMAILCIFVLHANAGSAHLSALSYKSLSPPAISDQELWHS